MSKVEQEMIEGTVDEVIYYNEDNGYIIFDIETEDDLITAKGALGEIDEGEQVRLTGFYKEDPTYGMQFNASFCERILPSTTAAILKYLASGAIKGIGAVMAERMVNVFGTETLTIIENDPERLTEVKGITSSKAAEIGEEFKRIHGARALMVFLGAYGITPKKIMAVWKCWGQMSEAVIRDDPYCLCGETTGITFQEADKIAYELGIDPENPSRIRAGLRFILENYSTGEGYTCLPSENLAYEAERRLGISHEKISDELEGFIEEDDFALTEKNGTEYAALPELDRAEKYIASRLRFMSSHFTESGEDISKEIEIEEKTKAIAYAEKQREAIRLALSSGFLILTGGPGTGKTTTLKAIISLFEQHGLNVMITAPTGRAAKRIADLTGYPAKTVHRLLESVFDGNVKFRKNEKDPLSADVVVIDEMSMVDTLLFEALLKAMKLSCRLIMVGDSDQLPSVGAGNVLGDMIDSGILKTVKLTEIFRQAQESRIVTNAHMIVNGQYPELNDQSKKNDFFFIPRSDIKGAQELICDLAEKRLPAAYDLSSIDDIQILCPSRKGMAGTNEMNKVLQERLNPHADGKAEIKGKYFTFRDGDKVMQCRNNYDIEWERDEEKGTGIFNGDIGTIVKVLRRDRVIVIDFEGRITRYPFNSIEDIEPAYAVTVHKSQGSEFPAVIIPLFGGYEGLYYRNLLYTAVTRAKKILIIVGLRQVVYQMVDNDRKTIRCTTLKERLLNGDDTAAE